MITPDNQRRDKLIAKGVTKGFLEAIDNAEDDEELELLLVYPDGSYFYLKDIHEDYEILKGYEITPIYEGCNGDTFWVMLSNENEFKFVHFELEQDEIYDDYGEDFKHLLADFIIDYYESAVDLPLTTIAQNALNMGFEKAEAFLKALREADEKGLRKTFESDAQWREKNIKLYC